MQPRPRSGTLAVASIVAVALALSAPAVARACGCFTPPDPSVPVVQAGERIVFAVDGGQVTAHIQIQYAGAASDGRDFGWLLPLPAVPKLELGSDELFTQLTSRTQPKYRLNYTNSCAGRTANAPSAPSAGGDGDGTDFDGQGGSPLVVKDSIGPYDYAVLKADDASAMLQWLKDNRYFTPVGTDAAVVPYVHPGAFFLALKLRAGKSAGDLQPVVVRYASDLPMIPIVLTSTAAQPDMGIQVWVLGPGRAIPRNYFHTVLNDATIDWSRAGANYNDVVIRATKEADGRHTFITEFAGTAAQMRGVLDAAGRFGAQHELAAQSSAVSFVAYLKAHGFGVQGQALGPGPVGVGGPVFGGALLAILQASIPYPAGLAQLGVSAPAYYAQLEYYLAGPFFQQHADLFKGLRFTIDATAMADEIWKRVVTPTLGAARLFDLPYLTRLYTTLSPEQMNRDPVFSFNAGLPAVSNVHQAQATFDCGFSGEVTGLTIITEQGFRLRGSGYGNVAPATSVPASLRIEILREAGAPEVVTENGGTIRHALGQDGCSLAPGAAGRGAGPGVGMATLLGALALLLRRRSRLQ